MHNNVNILNDTESQCLKMSKTVNFLLCVFCHKEKTLVHTQINKLDNTHETNNLLTVISSSVQKWVFFFFSFIEI